MAEASASWLLLSLKRGVPHDLFLRGMAGQLARHAALPHDENAIGHLQQLRHFRADHEDGRAGARQLVHQSEDFRFRAYVDAACRLVEEEYAAVAEEPLRDHHFLLIATAQPAYELLR